MDIAIDQYSGQALSIRETRNFLRIEPNTTWSFTIIPRERDHVLAITHLKNSSAQKFFEHFLTLSGKELEAAISAELIFFDENWFLNPNVWESYGTKKQDAILEAYDNFTELLSGKYNWMDKKDNAQWHEYLGISNRQQLNLFRYDASSFR